ncbi:MAG: zinc ribbon domain-containing protein [Anaerolineales bacterium]|nr:zinc ribbon domain-containing protein [Anaerolineales bacterium]
MRKLFLLFVLGGLFVFPAYTAAQNNVALQNVGVQLWPEYDQPSMLVITDFNVPENTPLPIDLTFRIPKSANLIAVANYQGNSALVDARYTGPKVSGDWQEFTVTLTSTAARFEYYDPIVFNGNERTYTYVWAGDYAADQFALRALEPLDVTAFSATPQLPSITNEGERKYHNGSTLSLAQGEAYTLELQYVKTSKLLVVEQPNVQPAAPVNEDTQGRVSLSKALPYVLGVLGIILVAIGAYFWRSGGQSAQPRRRVAKHSAKAESAEAYCPQCGERAKPGDRFCRTCGARLQS